MSTLIAYASKHGCTEKCAELLAQELGGAADLCDLAKESPNPGEYDEVLIGGSVYAGKIRKEVRQFCKKNLNILKGKKIGLFTCGLTEGDDALKQLESVFPDALTAIAVAKASFGSAYYYEKMNALEREIMKKITNSEESRSNISKENITAFAAQIKNVR